MMIEWSEDAFHPHAWGRSLVLQLNQYVHPMQDTRSVSVKYTAEVPHLPMFHTSKYGARQQPF